MQYVIWVVIISSVLVVINFITAAYVNRGAKNKKVANVLIEELNEENSTENADIVIEHIELKEEIPLPEERIDKKKTENIEYLKRIQQSVISDQRKLAEYAPESFILFKPMDYEGGDFYWFKNVTFTKGVPDEYGDILLEEYTVLLIATVDCKSLEVQEGFTNSINNLVLNVGVSDSESGVKALSDILNEIRTGLKNDLSKKMDEVMFSGGRDIVSLCVIDFKAMKLNFSGSHNPVCIARGGSIIELKSNGETITAFSNNQFFQIIDNTFDLQNADCIYFFTDGFENQFGGSEGKKIMFKGLKETLLAIQENTLEEQKVMLNKTFEFWKGALEQDDHVLIIGLKIQNRNSEGVN
ncbi:MAG: hypothetical protein V4608_00450 [Bacteroidota bacterium]